MIMDDNDGQMIFGDLGGLKLPDICLTGEEKPRKKITPRKLIPTGDRTRARCVTGAHATTCPTAVDYNHGRYKSCLTWVCNPCTNIWILIIILQKSSLWITKYCLGAEQVFSLHNWTTLLMAYNSAWKTVQWA